MPWSLKRIHRLILTSEAYKRGTAYDPAVAKIDPTNKFLARRRPRRVESEVIRDSMLAAAGTLNRSMYGPAFKAPIPPEAMLARNVKDPYPANVKDGPENHRRSIYMFHKRVVPEPLIQVFDGADSAASCGRRVISTVAPQALAMFNEPFVRLRAGELAQRVIREAGADSSARIRRAYLLALSRSPSQKELAVGLRFLAEHSAKRAARDKAADSALLALTDFTQALFGLNEFIYID